MVAILRSNPPARGLTEHYHTVFDTPPFRAPEPEIHPLDETKQRPPRPPRKHDVNSHVARVLRHHCFARIVVVEATTTFRHEGNGAEVVVGAEATWVLTRRGHPPLQGKGWRQLAEILEEVV